MSTYIKFPIETNPNTLRQAVYDYIQARSPSWTPNDPNLDVWIIQAITTLAAELREIASDVPDDIFRYFGATMMSIPPQDATHSTVSATIVMVDTAGYTIPAGAQFGIRDSVGTLVPFETSYNVVVPAGQTTITGVVLTSIDPGADTAGLGANGVTATLLDTYAFVASVTLTGVTSGGVDAETDDAYLSRLATALRLLSTRPILPIDFSIMARNIAGVYRAVAVDGYNPADSTYNNPRMIYVAAIDAAGADVSVPIQNQIKALLQANREVNFVINVGGANRTLIDVTFTGKAAPGYLASDVHDRVIAAITDYLNAATWGNASTDPQDWTDKTTVHYSEIAQVISNTEGLDYWTALTIGIHGGSMGTTDLNITAPASLALAGTISGSVS